MAKRFTDTEMWDKEWFMSLPCKLKCLVKMVRDKCDLCGVWSPNWIIATAYVGEKVNEQELLKIDNGNQFKKLENGKIYCIGFVEFQYGKLSEKSPVHNKIIGLLDQNEILQTYNKIPYLYPINRVMDKEEEKEEDKDKEKDKEKHSKKLNKIDIPEFLEISEFVKSKIDYYPQIENSLKLKYESWKENGWKDGNDKKIVNWKTKVLNTIQYLAKDFTKKEPEKVYKNDASKWDAPDAMQLITSKFKEVTTNEPKI